MEQTNSGENPAARGQAGDRVRPLESIERRVLGVLIEKAKTTPDQYPLSLNALVTGCNQKSNRSPLMTLDQEQVMRAVRSLQASAAVAEVFGSGALPRYRHLGYDWLGVARRNWRSWENSSSAVNRPKEISAEGPAAWIPFRI